MRGFLTRNKIYFETAGALSTAVFALIISIVSLFIALRSTEIAEQQTTITKNLNRPFIRAEIEPQFDSEFNLVASHVSLTNYGQPVRELRMEVYEFIQTECNDARRGVWNIYIPIHGYYEFAFTTGDPAGLIAKLNPLGNLKLMNDLYKRTLLVNKTSQSSAWPFFLSVVELRYETTFGEATTEYFQANPHGGNSNLDPTEAGRLIEIYKDYEEAEFTTVSFQNISPKDLLSWCEHSEPPSRLSDSN